MSGERPFYSALAAMEEAGTPFVLVVLVETLGSAPQDAGAKMLVTTEGRVTGTVGGGRVEAAALKTAQEMLTATTPRFVTWTLKGDIGMTCGGTVKFYFEPHPASTWSIALFGAGHVAQALVPVLLPLPCTLTCIDTRTNWLEKLPAARNLRVVHTADLAAVVDTLPADTFLLSMTQGHASDLPVLQRALATRDFPFLGVIGSVSKAAVLKRELVAAGITSETIAKLHCPIGLDFGTNHPHEIALSIAAQLLTERDRWQTPR